MTASNNNHGFKPFAGICLAVFALAFLSLNVFADSITVSETYKDNTVGGAYSTSTDSGTFGASLTVPGLSSFTADEWSNLTVSVNSSIGQTDPVFFLDEDFYRQAVDFSDFMADAVNFGGTVSATNAIYFFQLPDTNGDLVNAYQMTFSRSGNTFTISGKTLNPPAVQPPWSIVAYYNYAQTGRSIHDAVACEIHLQGLEQEDIPFNWDVHHTMNLTGSDTATTDKFGYPLDQITVNGSAMYPLPVVTPVSPAGSLTTNNPLVTVKVKATDTNGIANLEFYLNGADYGAGLLGSSNVWSTMMALPPGTNLIQAQAVDPQGDLSLLESLSVTSVNSQTNASSITFSEHWLDSYVYYYWQNFWFEETQDIGALNAALAVPGLQSMSADAWSNLVLTVSFGNINFSNSLAAADVLTTNSALFYLNDYFDPFANPIPAEQLSISRSGNTLVLALLAGGPPAGEESSSIVASSYYGLSGPVKDAQPFALTLLDGNTMNPYANILRPVYIIGTNIISSDAESDELNNIQVSGTADYVAPTNQITAPVAGQHWNNSVFTVTGKAGDNGAVSNVFYSVNNSAWAEVANSNNFTNWTAQAMLIPGTNTIAAYAMDASGNISTTNTVSFVYILSAVLTVNVGPGGTVVTNYNGLLLPLGQTYSMTAKTNTGFAFGGWTGSMVTNQNKLTFVMASNLEFAANFVETAKPMLTVTSPSNGKRMTNALAYVRGTASDIWGIRGVWVQLNGNLWNLSATTNAFTNWTANLTLVAGTNAIKVYAFNLGGNYSATNQLNVVSSNTFKLLLDFATAKPLDPNGLTFNLQVSTNLNGHIQISTNLINWVNLTNFAGTHSNNLTFRDAGATNSTKRFYRAVIP